MRRIHEGFVRDAIAKVSDFVRGRKIIATLEDAEIALAAVTEKQAKAIIDSIAKRLTNTIEDEYSSAGWKSYRIPSKALNPVLKKTGIDVYDNRFAWETEFDPKEYSSNDFEEFFVDSGIDEDSGTELYFENGCIVMRDIPPFAYRVLDKQKALTYAQALQILYEYVRDHGNIKKALGKYKDICELIRDLCLKAYKKKPSDIFNTSSPWTFSDDFAEEIADLDKYIRNYAIKEFKKEFKR